MKIFFGHSHRNTRDTKNIHSYKPCVDDHATGKKGELME